SLSSPPDAYSILFFDDDFDTVTVLRRGLEIQGFNVVAFEEPLLALEHFQSKSKQFALVISDIRMSKMNGFEFIKKIKEIKPEVIKLLSNQKSLDLFNTIAREEGMNTSESLRVKLKLTKKPHYQRMSALVRSGLVMKKQDHKYYLSAFGHIIYQVLLTIQGAM